MNPIVYVTEGKVPEPGRLLALTVFVAMKEVRFRCCRRDAVLLQNFCNYG
jgi:hypothetical protein